jgi:lysophospholipase L1-like esterase
MASTRRRQDAVPGYVALGDSYTIGTAVSVSDRFPDRLVLAVPRLELVANLGVNGYTSADLVRDELPRFDALDAGFVSVLIGVNDVVQACRRRSTRLMSGRSSDGSAVGCRRITS